jgi:hypothetical protein
MSSPTSRSLDLLRKSGYSACVVEKFLPQARIRQDAFGADVLACHATRQEVLLVQCTTASNLASRLKKAKALPQVAAWLQAGGKFECWGWFQKSGKWDVKQIAVTLEDLDAPVSRPVPRRRQARQAEQLSPFPDP